MMDQEHPESWPYPSFDARDWAESFADIAKKQPDIAIDLDTLTTWFASALMRGFDESRARAAPAVPDAWSASEALYGFMGWLTSRRQAVTLSATHDAAIAADLVALFCKRHGLAEPREGWHKCIIHETRES